jgi:glycogen debranching enzyme
LIGYGLSLYGFSEKMQRILKGLFDASLFLDLKRLPELFCGFSRRKGEGPAYPVACSPQAWSVAAVFLLLQGMLGMEIDAPARRLVFGNPVMPDFLDELVIRNLLLPGGNGVCHSDIEFYRYQNDVGIHVQKKPLDWDVVIKK